GPVTSMASAGCHQLLRDAIAVCVTTAGEVAELVGAVGQDALAEVTAQLVMTDGLDAVARRVLDAVPVRRGVPSESVLRTAGVADGEGRSALGLLELGGLVLRSGDRWVRARP
ncbi:MAG: DNA-protecting protein DprA, partial [Actinomycetota bacterium]|nr:DNA-protecting protein DprA [Actinomycetota bacterium]